jgi:hypothetical protein
MDGASFRRWLNRYVERWRVLVPFLALAVASVVAFWLVVALVHSNSARIREARVRDRQACRRQHFNVQMFRLFLREGSRQFERRPVRDGGQELRDFQRQASVLLDKADCRTVPR